MNINAQLARAIGWPEEQITAAGDACVIVVGEDRFPFDYNDPLVIEPIKAKYRPEIIPAVDNFWAHVPGSAMSHGKTENEAIARAVIAAEGIA